MHIRLFSNRMKTRKSDAPLLKIERRESVIGQRNKPTVPTFLFEKLASFKLQTGAGRSRLNGVRHGASFAEKPKAA